MKKLLFALLLTIISAAGFGQSKADFVSDALSKWKGMKSYTLAVAQAMPEEKYAYKPTADEMTFVHQLVHMAGNMYFLSAKLIRGIEPPVDINALLEKANQNISKKEAMDIISKAFDYTEETIAQMTDKTLEEELDYWGGHSTKRKIVFLLNDHQTHHRGQLIVYLRLNGIKPPAYIGW
mgnify:CR=1 FL=1